MTKNMSKKFGFLIQAFNFAYFAIRKLLSNKQYTLRDYRQISLTAKMHRNNQNVQICVT